MRRREFVTLICGTAASWPLVAHAQQAPMRILRVGVRDPFAGDDPAAQADIAVFQEALRNLGWTWDRNVRIDFRWSGIDPSHIDANVRELVGSRPDVILAVTPLALQPLPRETRSIPIVFVQIVDPVGAGLVASLVREVSSPVLPWPSLQHSGSWWSFSRK